MTDEPESTRFEEDAIRRDLADTKGDLGWLLDVQKRLVVLRRRRRMALDLERELGNRFLRAGEPLLAYDCIAGALRRQPKDERDPRLRQLLALALARLGETRRACRVLEKLSREPHDDHRLIDETFGILARTYKDFGLQCRDTDPDRAGKCWKRSLRHYKSAYKKTHNYYTGINAATLSLLLDALPKAREIAEQVLDDCLLRSKALEAGDRSAGDDPYWLAATLGEAALILGKGDDARKWYREANDNGRRDRRYGDMSSTRRQLASILFPKLKLEPSGLDDRFPMPRVAVFTGHMIDGPGRRWPRFPALPAVEAAVKNAIAARLNEEDVQIGYASAACGSDILFLEAVQDRGGETVVVLPYEKDLFRKDSVEFLPGSNWGERFDRILARSKVHTVSQYRLATQGISYEYANRVLHGMALTKAAQLESSMVHLSVWDQRPGDGLGGTADTVRRWRAHGLKVTVIDLEEVLASLPPLPANPPQAHPAQRVQPKGIIRGSDLVAILFADARGFSKLAEPAIPGFVEHFLGLIARQIDALPLREQPIKRNTWGDAVYLVFPDVDTAGRLALDIRDRLRETKWSKFGLPDELTMRIGLHAGPTSRCLDPVTKRDRFVGSHISLAARIEPIVVPGRVFTTLAFAVLAADSGVTDFTCRYLGLKALAKKAGIVPVYALERPGG
jgi:class 3 adenylate cyclase